MLGVRGWSEGVGARHLQYFPICNNLTHAVPIREAVGARHLQYFPICNNLTHAVPIREAVTEYQPAIFASAVIHLVETYTILRLREFP